MKTTINIFTLRIIQFVYFFYAETKCERVDRGEREKVNNFDKIKMKNIN